MKINFTTKQAVLNPDNPSPNEQISSGDANEIKQAVNANDDEMISLKAGSIETILSLYNLIIAGDNIVTTLKGGSNETIPSLRTSIDALAALLTNSPDDGSLVNTLGEVLAIFNQYPEGLSLINTLADKENVGVAQTIVNTLKGGNTTDSIATLRTSLTSLSSAITILQNATSNLNNTSDANKPVSTAQAAALLGKVDKVAGYSLLLNTEISKLAGLTNLYLGTYVSLAALQSAHPTASAGNEAIVDAGAGSNAIKYIYDVQEGWTGGGGGGASTFAQLTGSPSDNATLLTALQNPNTIIPDSTHRWATDALITAWNSAFSWGNHAGMYLLTTAVGSTVQAYSAVLNAFAALAPANDDFLQRKAGAWANRTIAQVKTDLGITGSQDLLAYALLTQLKENKTFTQLANDPKIWYSPMIDLSGFVTSGTISSGTYTPSRVGVLNMQVAAVASGASLRRCVAGSNTSYIPGVGALIQHAVIIINTLSTAAEEHKIFFGICTSTSNPQAATDCVGIEYQRSATGDFWCSRSRNNSGTAQTFTSTIPVTTGQVWLTLELSADGKTASFKINNVLMNTFTSASLLCRYGIPQLIYDKTVGTATFIIGVDDWYDSYSLTTPTI